LLKKQSKAVSQIDEPEVQDLIEEIVSNISRFRQECEQIDFDEVTQINIEKLTEELREISCIIKEVAHQYRELISVSDKNKKPKWEFISDKARLNGEIRNFQDLNYSIDDFIEFLKSPTVLLSNNPFLLLSGEAGVGKSHLLADVASKRNVRNQFSILLLGQHFTVEEPWNQIKKLLQISCERDIFLSALSAKAETKGSRILIFIDAINEGEGKSLWKNYLAGFVVAVKKFPYIAVVFSIRSSYENLLIHSSLLRNKELIKVVHHGFQDHEYDASKLFFENFNIKQPSIPLLHQEFSNPLFLKLFCEGLHNRRLQEIPDGYEGISTIMNFYLDSVDCKISEKHNLPVRLNIIKEIIMQFALRIAESDFPYLNYKEACAIVGGTTKDFTIINQSLIIEDLISEGLLIENLYWDKDNYSSKGVYIAYERFSDHLICSFLLKNYFDINNPTDSFLPGSRFYKFTEDNSVASFNQGIVDSFSIQLPETANIELFEAAPHARGYRAIALAFIDSIIWRKKGTIHKGLSNYINEIANFSQELNYYFINTILSVTSDPDQLFNSDFLHQHLMKYSMADRDSWWTQFIHNQYPGYPDEITRIRRIIDWAWTDDHRENISDESIRLMCQTMFWFLTSTNRNLRDSATKGIICLLEERINVLMVLINTFKNVNDPYVLQRLYAVAYGCAVRTSDIHSLKQLGNLIFNTVFNTENVIPDVLLRDYARGIIEYAVSKGHDFSFDLSNVRPPFKSYLPNELPNNEEIKKYEYDSNTPGFQNYYMSRNFIIRSMKTDPGGPGYGDFGRYVFQSALTDWKVNARLFSNLAVKWIIEEYGYDVEKHGEFDWALHSHNYDSHNVFEERIGKKYQWIAFYEILARVSDNCPCYANSFSDEAVKRQFEGPWDPYVRDIDPTTTIRRSSENKIQNFWWNSVVYNNWDIPNKQWLSNHDDLPSPLQMISVSDGEGVEWLVLEIRASWYEPAGIGEEEWSNAQKNLRYEIGSYLTKKQEHNKILKWAVKRDLVGSGIPQTDSVYELFSREYYWAPVFNRNDGKDCTECDWRNLIDDKKGKNVGEVAVTTVGYFWEGHYDASQQSQLSFLKPTEILFRILDLQYSKIEGQLLNKKGEMICFDPSATHPTHSCLVVRKHDLLQKLDEYDLNILWTVLGEKHIITGRSSQDSYMGKLDISGVVHFKNGELVHLPHFVEKK
jgi:hypothetical protein